MRKGPPARQDSPEFGRRPEVRASSLGRLGDAADRPGPMLRCCGGPLVQDVPSFDSETLQPCKQPGCASKTRFPQAFMGLDQGGEKTRRQSCSVRPPAPGCVRGLQPGLSTAVCPRFRGFAVVGLSLPCPPCHGGMRDGTNRIPTGAAPDRKRSGDGALGMKLVCLGPVSPCDPAGQGRSRVLSMSLVTGIKAV